MLFRSLFRIRHASRGLIWYFFPIASKSAPFRSRTHRSIVVAPLSLQSKYNYFLILKKQLYPVNRHNCFSNHFLIYFFFLFVAFLEVFVFITYHRAPVIHTEEYPPQMIPAISGAANSRIELTPIINRTNTMINVVNDV